MHKPQQTPVINNLLSVNLEDYFQVSPLRRHVPHRYWPRFALRVEKNTLQTLDLLDKYNTQATFFVIGWLAERCPELIQEVARRGHEIASKGYYHRAYKQMSIDQFHNEFRDDFRRSRDVISAASGREVLGYRIAEGSLPVDDLRPFEILAKEGVRYDSSIRPFGLNFLSVSHWHSIHPVSQDDWSIIEVPLSSFTLFGVPIPITGGNYFRQLPQAAYDRLLSSYLKHNKAPWHFYFHTWELDPEQPRVSAISLFGRMRQYRNLSQMRLRIEHSLKHNTLRPIADYLGMTSQAIELRPACPSPPLEVAQIRPARQEVTIVVPCYNEEESLNYLAGTLASFEKSNADSLKLSYVFVDDGSQDSTWDMLQTLFGQRSNCALVQHPNNRGIAAATLTGIQHASTEIVCGIDCDCSFDPHTLADMIPLLSPEVDMVQASPYHPDGGVLNVPGWRLALSKNLSRLYRRILNHKFASYTACFRVYRRSKTAHLKLDDSGFLGIAEIFIRLDQSGSKIIEFPTTLESRLMGQSKMKTLAVIQSHLGMLKRLIVSRSDFRQPPRTDIRTP